MALPISIPATFARQTIAREGDGGASWLRSVPERVQRLSVAWDLTIESEALAGTTALVWLVRRQGVPAALKIGWPDLESRDEAEALRMWNGDGAARVLDSERPGGAMLLERLDHRRSLLDVPIDEALVEAVTLMRRLHRPAAPRASFMPVLAQLDAVGGETGSAAAQRSRPAVEAAVRGGDAVILHGDFHYANVLADGCRWAAIDPKPALGPPEWDYLPLLRNRFDQYDPTDLPSAIRHRLNTIIDLDGGDRAAAFALAHFRSVLNVAYAERVRDRSFRTIARAIAAATAT